MSGSPPTSELVRSAQALLAGLVAAVLAATYWLACALLLFLVVALSLQVFFRYVLEAPLPWSEEAARFALVWLSMLAACLAAHEGDHFVFRWITMFLPDRPRFWLRRLVDLVVAATLAIILVESVSYLQVVAQKTAAGTGLNMRVPYFGVTFGAAVMILVYAAEALDGLLSCLTGQVFSVRERQEASVAELLGADGPARP